MVARLASSLKPQPVCLEGGLIPKPTQTPLTALVNARGSTQVCAVGDKINGDRDVGDLLKLVFVPDYNVSTAEVLIPASELSQHISTAGESRGGEGEGGMAGLEVVVGGGVQHTAASPAFGAVAGKSLGSSL